MVSFPSGGADPQTKVSDIAGVFAFSVGWTICTGLVKNGCGGSESVASEGATPVVSGAAGSEAAAGSTAIANPLILPLKKTVINNKITIILFIITSISPLPLATQIVIKKWF
jgi:hypothetical protein